MGGHIPWFAWRDADGVPHVTILDRDKWFKATQDNLCWICGHPLGPTKVFVLGPLQILTRTSFEPPSHLECAKRAMRVCPFLSNPSRGREPVPRNPDQRGLANPGAFALWATKSYKLSRLRDKLAIKVGDPIHVTWWARGRLATEAEVRNAQTEAAVAVAERV
jgi:hypothetical protein